MDVTSGLLHAHNFRIHDVISHDMFVLTISFQDTFVVAMFSYNFVTSYFLISCTSHALHMHLNTLGHYYKIVTIS